MYMPVSKRGKRGEIRRLIRGFVGTSLLVTTGGLFGMIFMMGPGRSPLFAGVAAAGALVAAGIIVGLIWLTIRRHGRGLIRGTLHRSRCATCGFDLTDLPREQRFAITFRGEAGDGSLLTCPECGEPTLAIMGRSTADTPPERPTHVRANRLSFSIYILLRTCSLGYSDRVGHGNI